MNGWDRTGGSQGNCKTCKEKIIGVLLIISQPQVSGVKQLPSGDALLVLFTPDARNEDVRAGRVGAGQSSRALRAPGCRRRKPCLSLKELRT